MKKFLALSIFLTFLVMPAFPEDWQWWNEVELKHKINDRAQFIVKSEQKFKDSDDLYLYNIVPGVDISWKEWLGIGLNYKYEREEKGNDWLDEHRIEVQPVLKWKWNNVKFSDRNRIEYRMFDHKDNSFRYRNRLKASFPVQLGNIELGLYAYDELFYDFSTDEFNQNRMAFGATKKLSSALAVDIYYLYKSKKSSDWSGTNVIGTKLTLAF